ncbi:hypothetical protein C8R45DRAFT_935104 [Mycena sanguinolenta]|nr:hypothetical protein C8R45DRAFT_935000 [Mycena sanguinolenta]KAJ6475471.1 hypothetical protein C8R45DRAFT_935104 [Mycena sanguinolenta]
MPLHAPFMIHFVDLASSRVLDIDIDTAGEKQHSTRRERLANCLDNSRQDGVQVLLFIWIRSPPALNIGSVLLLRYCIRAEGMFPRLVPTIPRPSCPYAAKTATLVSMMPRAISVDPLPVSAIVVWYLQNAAVEGELQAHCMSSTHLELADTNNAREKIRLLVAYSRGSYRTAEWQLAREW